MDKEKRVLHKNTKVLLKKDRKRNKIYLYFLIDLIIDAKASLSNANGRSLAYFSKER